MRKILQIAFFFTFMTILIPAVQAQDWTAANGNTTVATLNEVHFVTDNVAYAVGNRGNILKSTDGGQTWADVSYEGTKNFQSVYFFDENTGFVGAPFSSGDGGSTEMLAKTTDGGESWEIFSSFDFDDFNDMEFLDEQNGWVASIDGQVLHTSDNGENWESKSAGSEDLLDIHLFNENTFWAAGESGSLYKSTDEGETWELAVQLDTIAIGEFSNLSANDNLYGVEFVDENLGYAIGKTYIDRFTGFLLKTTDGGESWFAVDYDFQHIFYDIEIGENGEIILAGGRDQFTETESNAIYISEDEGESWKVISDGAGPLYWNDIDSQGDTWITVGESGASTTFSLSDDTLGTDLITGFDIADISFSSPDNGVFVTGGMIRGKIFATNNGGDTWVEILGLEGFKAFTSVDFTGENIWVVGSDYFTGDSRWIIYHSSDSGSSWEKSEPDIPDHMQTNYLEKTQFIDGQTGFIKAENMLLKTSDGGDSWEQLSEPESHPFSSFKTFHFWDEQTGWLAGEEQIAVTTDGGDTWEIKYEQDSFDPEIVEIQLVNATTGYVTQERGDMLKTEDGGDTWEELSTFSNFDLNDLHFTTPDTGYIVGDGGRILTTTDGGENFSVNYNITGKTLSGISIINDQLGWIAGEKGVLLSTSNGGGIATSIHGTEPSDLPSAVKLNQNYPNPFNPSTVIRYQLPENSLVQLEVFDVLGQRVAVIVNGERKSAGTHSVIFTAENLSSGIYIYQLKTSDEVITKKMMLVK